MNTVIKNISLAVAFTLTLSLAQASHNKNPNCAPDTNEAAAQAVIEAFEKFHAHLKVEDFNSVWDLLTDHLKTTEFNNDPNLLLQQFSDPHAKALLLNLKPLSVTPRGRFMALTVKANDQAMEILYAKQADTWKIYRSAQTEHSDWKQRVLPKMQKHSTENFDIYYLKGSTAQNQIEQIARQREKGFREICKVTKQDPPLRICLVLFEDEKTKQLMTSHQGAGWAYGHTIVEVYNHDLQLDPYHETTHLLMANIGDPPAMFNEGFATYMAQRLGANALQHLAGTKSSIHQHARKLKNNGQLIPLAELITYTDIGPELSKPSIAYPESASFVKFLIETYGEQKFLNAYRQLKKSPDQNQNLKTLNDIYKKSLSQLGREWKQTIMKAEYAEEN